MGIFVSALMAAPLALAAPFTNDFTLGIIGDTQRLTHSWGGRTAQENERRFRAITQWFKDNADSLNIAFISHMGDMVDNAGDPAQWMVAKGAMQAIRDAGRPWGGCPGNHDVGNNYAEWNTHFGLGWWQGNAWFGGNHPPGRSENQYQTFTYGANQFLWLHLENRAGTAAVAWAQGVLNQHPGRVTFVTTHDYMSERGFEAYGETLWNSLIRMNPQIVAVFCGHQFGTAYVQRRNNAGRVVHNFLIDYQDETDDNLQGATRWMEVNVGQNRVYSNTVNPSLNDLRITGSLRPNSFTGWALDSANKSPLLAHHNHQFITDNFFTPALSPVPIIKREIRGFRFPRGGGAAFYGLDGRRLNFHESALREIRQGRPGPKAFVVRFKNGGETILMGYYPVLTD